MGSTAFADDCRFTGEIETIMVGDLPIYRVTPDDVRPALRELTLFDLHGGGMILLGGEACRSWTIIRAMNLGVEVVSVDYRMPPDHPFPAPLDDCVAGYLWLLERCEPEKIVVGGVSAGGNLAAATVLRARDERLPLPAGVVLQTPEVDLTESGDSFVTNLDLDLALGGSLADSIALYAGGHDLAHPYLSPLFADFTKGFPPTFLSTGTRDLFLSNTVRMHRALRDAAVPAELHVFEAMPHGGFGSRSPEDHSLNREVAGFLEKIADPAFRWTPGIVEARQR